MNDLRHATTDAQLGKRISRLLSDELAERCLSPEQFNRLTEIETELLYMIEDIDGQDETSQRS